jgi:hypothetical protein
MNFCDAWYCLAYLKIGGGLEITAPIGMIVVVFVIAALAKWSLSR